MELFGLCKGVVAQGFQNITLCDMYDDVFSDFYDTFVKHTNDVEYYIHLSKQMGKKILDLGCGSGRIMLPLLEAGFEVTGVDLSESMLAILKKKIQRHGTSSQIIHGDICNFKCDEKFDFAILPETTLNIIEDRSSMYRNIYDKLKENACLEVSYIDYDSIQQSQTYPSSIFFDGMRKKFCIMTEKIVKEQKKVFVNLYMQEEDDSGIAKKYIACVSKNIIRKEEIEQEIQAANFVSEYKKVQDIGRYYLVHELYRKKS